MGELSRVQISYRRPQDAIQRPGRGCKGGSMLGIARKHGNAYGLVRGLDRRAAICPNQNDQRQNADDRTERNFSK